MKKTFLLLLCLLFAVASFVGCGLNPGSAPAGTAAKDEAEPTEAPAPAEETPAALPEDYAPDFCFSTVDDTGAEWTEACFAEAKLTMINFWEPWCGPCVGEMPELQKLSENYRDKGFQILGVYSDFSYEKEMRQVVEQTGVQYPILKYVDAFSQFQTGYVPTTIFVDGSGHVVGETQIGSRDYDSWAAIVEGLL